MSTNVSDSTQEPNYFVIYPLGYLEIYNHRQCTLLGVMNSLTTRKGYCYATNKTLAKIIKCSTKSIERDLWNFEQDGVITREVIRDDSMMVVERRIFIKNDIVGNPPRPNVGHPPSQPASDPRSQDVGVNSNKTISYINSIKDTYSDEFDEIWKLYTKKGVKSQAYKAFKRLSLKEQRQALEHIPSYIVNHQENNKMPYLPHMATYLNQKRFQDALPYEGTSPSEGVAWE